MSAKQLFVYCLLTFLIEKCFCQDIPSTIASTVLTTLIPNTIASANTESPSTTRWSDYTNIPTTTTATTEQTFCSSDYDCYGNNGDYNKVCYNGKCKCKLGYSLNEISKCSEIDCFLHSDCYNVHENTVCSDRRCTCKQDGYLEKTSQTCIQQSSEKNVCDSYFSCESTFGYYSHCFDRKCGCKLGYRLLNGHCTKEVCDSDYECYQFQSNTKCSDKDCVCADGYYFHNTTSQACEYLKSCSLDWDCKQQIGSFSVCHSSACKCELGYRLVAGKCTQTSCSGNLECTLRDPNTQCKYGNCVCDSNSYLNSNDQTCTTVRTDPPVDNHFDNLSVGLPALLVVLLIFVMFIAVYRVRRRIAQRTRDQSSNFPLTGSSCAYPNRTPPPPYSPTNPNPTSTIAVDCSPEQTCPDDPPPPYSEVSVSNEQTPETAHPPISLHV